MYELGFINHTTKTLEQYTPVNNIYTMCNYAVNFRKFSATSHKQFQRQPA